MNAQQKANRTGVVLAFILLGVVIYSYIVIKTRGKLPEPANLTRTQKILRGL
jgi:hypothetical protein